MIRDATRELIRNKTRQVVACGEARKQGGTSPTPLFSLFAFHPSLSLINLLPG